jgi:phytoene dehydrogenase-like protein
VPGRPPAPHRPEPGRYHDAMLPGTPTRAQPRQRSPLPGLHPAGHWTTPGAGLPRVVRSGHDTAGVVPADAGGHPQWTQ